MSPRNAPPNPRDDDQHDTCNDRICRRHATANSVRPIAAHIARIQAAGHERNYYQHPPDSYRVSAHHAEQNASWNQNVDCPNQHVSSRCMVKPRYPGCTHDDADRGKAVQPYSRSEGGVIAPWILVNVHLSRVTMALTGRGFRLFAKRGRRSSPLHFNLVLLWGRTPVCLRVSGAAKVLLETI